MPAPPYFPSVLFVLFELFLVVGVFAGFTPPRITSTPFPGPSSLPTIVGSPTKVTTGFQFPIVDAARDASPTSPLQTPFGTARTKTCPDNIAAVGYSPDSK